LQRRGEPRGHRPGHPDGHPSRGWAEAPPGAPPACPSQPCQRRAGRDPAPLHHPRLREARLRRGDTVRACKQRLRGLWPGTAVPRRASSRAHLVRYLRRCRFPAPTQAFWQLAMLRIASGPGSLGWMSRGACRQADPGLFFPVSVTGTRARQAEAAKTACCGCAVRANCLLYALETMPEGIWGGTTLEEHRAARRSAVRRTGHAAGQRVTSNGTA
jgi:WhiB family transcriptional regulator, redox-sensing transcriptional regulator